MINVGIIGLGGISGAHLPAYQNAPELARVIARCDKIPERAQGTAQVEFNIAVEGGKTQVQATPYTDYRDLIADPEVDVVDICLPTDLHAEVAVAALEAGKHVLSEKPMALNVEQCDRMVAAAKAADRILMVAHCIRFWPEYVYLKELVDSKQYGALLQASFTRISGAPLWSTDNWYMNPARSGGAIQDLHIHDSDFIPYLMGRMPDAVSSQGRENASGIGYIDTEYHYDDGQIIRAEGGWDFAPGLAFRMTFFARFEGATVEWDGTRGPLTVYLAEGGSLVPELLPGDGYSREIAYFLNCVATGTKPTIVTPEYARESIRLIHAEAEALHTGKRVAL